MSGKNGSGSMKGLLLPLGYLLLSLIAAAIISFRAGFSTTELFQNRLYFIYFLISVFSALFSLVVLVVDYLAYRKGEASRAFFMYDSSPARVLGRKPIIAFFTWLAVFVFAITASGVLGKSVIPTPNFYSEGPLSAEVLAAHSTGENIFNVGFLPAFEELPVFLLVSVVIWLITFLLKKRVGEVPAFLLSLLPALFIGALFFTFAHGVSYGEDLGAFVGAFVYSIITQGANQLTGLFFSPLVHFMHNSLIVVFSLSISLAIGAACIFPFKIKKQIGGAL